MSKNQVKYLLYILIITFLVGCAKRPENVSASYYSPNKFSEYTCQDIHLEIKMIENNYLPELYKKQDSKANSDIITLGLSGLFRLNHNYENQISRLKGKLEALNGIQVKKGCPEKIGLAAY